MTKAENFIVASCSLLFFASAPSEVLARGADLTQNAVHDESALAESLDTYLTRAEAFGFSGAVLVMKKGQVVLCQGYGLADRARGIAFGRDTAFDLGSVTKQFTAAAVLKLETMGKLATSHPISRHLTDVPPDKSAITIHQLLTHTSGLRRDGLDRNRVMSRDQVVSEILATQLLSKPGET